MRSGKRLGRGGRVHTGSDTGRPPAAADEDRSPDPLAADPGDFADYDDGAYEIFRVECPACARPIALLADEDTLPEHALCPSPWNPFGLTVCAGSGRAVEDAAPIDTADDGGDVAALLTLPEGLDWRTQPFSHAGAPRPRLRQALHG